jgi:hypothetical protein
MSRKEWVLVALVLVLGGLWVVYFSGWFAPKIIRIESTVRSAREAWGPNGRQVTPPGQPELGGVSFALHRNYKLTSVKVVAVRDVQPGKTFVPTLWELVAKQGSQPVDSLAYGLPVAGMTPAKPGVDIQPLEPGVAYRLLVEAGAWKGTRDFMIPRPQTSPR